MSNRPPEDTAVSVKTGQFIVSRLTPSQPGALGIVGIYGDRACPILNAYFHAFKGTSIESLALGCIAVGYWYHELVTNGEGVSSSRKGCGQTQKSQECVVLVRTGIQSWEIHTHGGMAVVQSFLEIFESAGADEVSWNKWLTCMQKDTRDTTVRKQLAQVDGSYAAQILTRQLAGFFQSDISRVQQVLDMTPRCLDRLVVAQAIINRLKQAARIGLRLTQPWRVILLGPVNAGKSSLVNALAGYDRSIVSPHAGTTRDVLETRVVIAGWSVDFIDTAGFHLADTQKKKMNEIERKGIDRAAVAAMEADLILHVQPLDQSVNDGFSITKLGDDLPPYITVGTKSDLCDTKQSCEKTVLEPLVRTSARTGHGIDRLIQIVLEKLVPEIREQPDCFLEGVPISPEDVDVVRKLHEQAECYSRDL